MKGGTNVGGGASLNFKVVGGTTQPATASKNTIWVNTDTAITEWVFSATEPESRSDGSSLEGGEVWFYIGNSCNTPINAIKKNILMVYPISCQQYVDGAWVIKEAKVYQNADWQDMRNLTIWLFNNGDLGESGGFQASAGTLTVGSEIYHSIMSGTSAYVTATNQIDLTSFSTVTFTCYAAGVTREYAHVGVGLTRTGFVAETAAASSSYAEVTVDVSSLTGLHYVGFRNRSYSTANTSEFYVSSIVLS